jgi:4-hydroxyproline epimerase
MNAVRKTVHKQVQVVDSHTGGEPTRLVISGGPDLGSGTIAERLQVLRSKYDDFRAAVVEEPRGSDIIVGGLICTPSDPSCVTGIIFFNNVGYLGMCGHGTIGLVATLAHLGEIEPGEHRIETCVGVVTAKLHESGDVSIRNVPSFRFAHAVPVDVPGHGRILGDIAWGGNWFFLVGDHGQELELKNVEQLTNFTWSIRQSLERQGITGKDGQEIDHIELFAPSPRPGVGSRNFVLCPGKAYDRSPCGTGTSAKLACLYADEHLKPGQVWRQESIVGSVFEGSIEVATNGAVIPTIKGQAYVTAEATLILDPRDPFEKGIRKSSAL